MFTILITMTMIISINIMIIFLIIILIMVFFILIIILIIMILVIVMRPRARLTPHLPVNYGNSLQVSTHGRPAPRSKNRALKRGLQHTALHTTFIHWNARGRHCIASFWRQSARRTCVAQHGFTASHEPHCAAPRATTLPGLLHPILHCTVQCGHSVRKPAINRLFAFGALGARTRGWNAACSR